MQQINSNPGERLRTLCELKLDIQKALHVSQQSSFVIVQVCREVWMKWCTQQSVTVCLAHNRHCMLCTLMCHRPRITPKTFSTEWQQPSSPQNLFSTKDSSLAQGHTPYWGWLPPSDRSVSGMPTTFVAAESHPNFSLCAFPPPSLPHSCGSREHFPVNLCHVNKSYQYASWGFACNT